MKVESNAICVKPAWNDARYSSEIPVSSVSFQDHFPVNAHTRQSNPRSGLAGDITRTLKSVCKLGEITTKLHASPKRISEVSRALKRREAPSQISLRDRHAKMTNALIIVDSVLTK
jgi:hypothetical protein